MKKTNPAVECISVKCRVNSLGVISGRRVDSEGRVADQAPLPQSGSNAGKSASGSGERTGGRNGQSGTENPGRIQKVFLVMIYRINLHNPSKV